MARLKAAILIAGLVLIAFGEAACVTDAAAAPDSSAEEYGFGDDQAAKSPPETIPLPTRKPTMPASSRKVDLPSRNPVPASIEPNEKPSASTVPKGTAATGEVSPAKDTARVATKPQHKAAGEKPAQATVELPEQKTQTAGAKSAGQKPAVRTVGLPARKPPKPRPAPRTSSRKPPVTGGQRTREQQCTALRKCRGAFSKCRFSKKREETDADGWEVHKVKCGEEYSKCIRENFREGEMAFTRWFIPYDPCK